MQRRGAGMVTAGTIDATGEKMAFMGRVVWPSRTGTKNISRVHFLFGTVVKAGGSALTISLQDISAASGPPTQPDGVQDQTVAVANGDASFVSNTWYRSGTLSSARTVSYGESLAIVIEFDGSGKLGSDSVSFNVVNDYGRFYQYTGLSYSLYTSSWSAIATYRPNCLFEFDDGTFGVFMGGDCFSAQGGVAISTTTTPDEIALKMSFPFACSIDGASLVVGFGSYGVIDFDVLLYNAAGTALRTVSIDSNTIVAASNYYNTQVVFEPITLTKDAVYYIAFKPTISTRGSLVYVDVSNSSYMAVLPGGVNLIYSERTDGGSWSDTDTRRPAITPLICALDDGVSSGGGGRPVFGDRNGGKF